MLGLYLDTLIIGQTLCNILSILSELTLQKEIQISEQQQQQQIKLKNPCQSLDSNAGPFAAKADSCPLDH